MRYAFVAEHRSVFSVRAMCRCLRVHPSGFYAWLKTPLSKRAREDIRQTELLSRAWKESGKVYGYRKLHDDLLDQGETCCLNRVARLTRLAGIKAQIGYRRRPGSYGGKPSMVIENSLDRQFDVEESDTVWVTDITYIRTLEGFAYLVVVIDLFSRRVAGPFSALQATPARQWVDAEPSDHGSRVAGIAHGRVAKEAEEQGSDPLGPGLTVHQHGLGFVP